MKRLAFALIACLALAGFAGAAQAASAYTTRGLNLYSGASSRSQLIATVPAGEYVRVGGCIKSYVWCDVSWAGYRGWARSNGLSYRHAGYRHFPDAVIGLGIPIIAAHIIFRHHPHRPWIAPPVVAPGSPVFPWRRGPWPWGVFPQGGGAQLNGSGGQGN